MRKSKSSGVHIQSIINEGPTVSDPLVIANKFNEFFASIATLISDDIPPTDRPPDMHPATNATFNTADNPVTFTELSNIVANLKCKRSEDLNGLSMFLVKQIFTNISIPLSHIFNLSLSKGYVPSQLKVAKIVPIFKSGDSQSMDNYHPISLLSAFSKILERVMCARLVTYLESNNIISPNQYGFRKKHSTLHPVIHLLNKVTQASNEKKVSLAIFCDLRKAFDTCDHEILLNKMFSMGIRGAELISCICCTVHNLLISLMCAVLPE